MERIMVIGGNGSGKTTFSRQLSKTLNLPVIHLDALYWKDHWGHATNEEFDQLLLAELNKKQWIMDGNMNRTIPFRLEYCDCVIYFDFSRTSCLFGVIKRVVKHYGKSRSDMGGYCPERFDLSFLKNVWKFNQNHRKRYYEMLNNANGVKVIVLKNHREVKQYLRMMMNRRIDD